jgi:hypothetical protein
MFYRARWCDPQQGRFASDDPIGFRGGVNRYSYVTGNPLKFIDPSGTQGCSACQPDTINTLAPGVPTNPGNPDGSRVDPERYLPYETRKLLAPYFPEIDLTETVIHRGIPGYVPIDALGYTDQHDVYFKHGDFDPCSVMGIALIGHELTHTRQYAQYGKWSFRARYLGNSLLWGLLGEVVALQPKWGYDLNPFERDADVMQQRIVDDMNTRFGETTNLCTCRIR